MEQTPAHAAMQDESESENDGDPVVARSDMGTAFYLFSHQAGGHRPFLRSAKGEVCKPAIPLEFRFYQALDTQYPQLKPFVPPFVGVTTVDLHPTTYIAATADVVIETPSKVGVDCEDSPPSTKEPPHESSASTTVVDGEMLHALNLQPPTTMAAAAASPNGKKRRLDTTQRLCPSPCVSPSGPTRSYISTASYSAKLWTKERSKADAQTHATSLSAPSQSPSLPSRAGTRSVSREYLVLGDLTHAYARPCVLDIKMGTRQHGEDAPPAKATSHSAKCAATTSLALGLRICGMQVYDEVEQRYILWDKHWGRQLQEADIEPALTNYLSNSLGLHRDSLRSLRDQLQALERVVAQTTGVRFWGASLLLIYEGDRRRAAQREDVHLIDFAHCQMSSTLTTPDDGLLLGLANLIQFLSNILETHHDGAVLET